MLIEHQSNTKAAPPQFGSVKIGESFVYHGNIYIKIAFISTVYDADKGHSDGNANAVRLGDGYLKKFQTTHEVEPVPHAKVVY